MAKESPMMLNEALLLAFGITREQLMSIRGAMLKLSPYDLPLLQVEFIVKDEAIPAVATAVAEYQLVRKA